MSPKLFTHNIYVFNRFLNLSVAYLVNSKHFRLLASENLKQEVCLGNGMIPLFEENILWSFEFRSCFFCLLEKFHHVQESVFWWELQLGAIEIVHNVGPSNILNVLDTKSNEIIDIPTCLGFLIWNIGCVQFLKLLSFQILPRTNKEVSQKFLHASIDVLLIFSNHQQAFEDVLLTHWTKLV